jgi:hypothetical protein
VILPGYGEKRCDEAGDAATASAGLIRDAQMIINTVLSAVARGAKGARMDPSATESLHERFLLKVRPAFEKSDWRSDWHHEEVYVRAFAEALGRRAAILAAWDRRTVITGQDIDDAAKKMCGYMPIAGRWCPP